MKTPSRRSTHKLVISSALAIILCCAGDIAGAQAAGAKTPGATSQPDSSSSVVLVGEKTLVLDPACNACMGAMLPLILQYPARTGATRPVALLARTADPSLQAGVGAPAPGSLELQLHADHLVSDSNGVAAAGVETTVEGAAPKISLPSEIRPGESVPIIVRVKGILPAGKWKTTIYNGKASLGDVVVVVPDVTFRIGLDPVASNDGKMPAVTVTRGERASILLKNEDAVGYWLNWVLRVDDKKDAATSLHKDNNDDPDAKIAAGGQFLVEFEPKPSWFAESGNPVCSWPFAWMERFDVPCNWRAVFKDKEAEGLLTVQLASPACKNDAGAAVRVLRIPLTLAYYGPNKKAFWSYCAIFLLLLAGASLSLYINYKFPDEQIRSDLKEQLGANAKEISDLSMTLASRLRVLVGIENRLMTDRLKYLKWYSTEFEKQRSEIAECTARLAKRIDQLRRVGRLRDDYEVLTTNEVPPTLLAKLEDSFEQLGRMLDDFHMSDSDLQDSEIKVKELQQAIMNWKQPDSATVGELVDLLLTLYNDLQGTKLPGRPAAGTQQPGAGNSLPPGRLAKSPTLDQILLASPQTPLYLSVQRLIEELTEDFPAAAQITTATYYRKGLAAYRGDTLRRYIVICDTRNPAVDSPLVAKRDDLISLLATESWNDQRKARRLVWEMSETIYVDDIKNEIEAKRVEISLDRNLLRAFEPALFNIRFTTPKFNTCTAREEWCCTINFGHGPFEDEPDPHSFLEERGWSVAHYFPHKGWYTLRATFRHDEAQDPAHPVGQIEKQILVGPPQDEIVISGRGAWIRRPWRKFAKWFQLNGNAILRLVLALIPAVLGLVAGAKEQLLKMDLFLALSAVFVLGFSSDQVKNLLSQKTKT